MKTIVRHLIGAGLAAVLTTSLAWAQQPQLSRVRGTIESVEGSMLTVRAGEGPNMKVKLADDVQVYGLVKATLTDIKPGVFVGVGATPQPDGGHKAIQLTIFAESQRGLGEGHRPWDRPGSTMTNGTVDTTVKQIDGHLLTVKYKDGEKKIIVTPESIIRAYVIGNKSELKPGANVSTFGTKNSDGAVAASRITVGRDGVVP